MVSIIYTLTDKEGTELDSSEGAAFEYLQGHGNIVPGLERKLDGRTVGDKLRVEVAPADGYGDRREDAVRQLPRGQFPPGSPLEPGAEFAAESPDGHVVPFWVLEVTDKVVTVDFNHPLAGETLFFDVEITGVRDASGEELAHGHVHSGGHHHH